MSLSSSSRGAALAGVNLAAVSLATIVTALRCYVRIKMLKAFGSDDWLMVAAQIFFIFYCSFSLAGVGRGTGHHVAELTQEQESDARMWWWYCYPTYAVTMLLTKLSIAMFFRRVIVQRLHKWILITAAGVTFISCAIFFFACIFQCWPVSYFWNKHSQSGTCIPDTVVIVLAYLFSAINIITDFTFALLPAWITSHLNMKLKTKVALTVLMGMGCVASAAVVVRLPYLHHISSPEFLHDTVPVALWSTVEQCLAITAGGLATLQPLVKLVAYKLGLRSSPSMPLQASGYGGSMHLNRTAISVKKSFAHRSETFTPGDKPFDPVAMQLQPSAGTYSAACYNTSQELLREPTAGSNESKDSGRDSLGRNQSQRIARGV